MSTARLGSDWSAFWNRQVAQWAIVLGLVLVVLVVLARKAQEVQALAEMTAVRESVTALRTTLVIAFLHQQVRGEHAAGSTDPNPFLQLERLPSNYTGLRAMEDGVLATPGSWYYDPVCNCIGYRLMFPQWLSQPGGGETMGWHVERDASGMRTLRAFAPYRWFSQPIS